MFKNYPKSKLEWQKIFSQYSNVLDFLVDLIAQDAKQRGVNKRGVLKFVEKTAPIEWKYNYSEHYYMMINLNAYYRFYTNSGFMSVFKDYYRDEMTNLFHTTQIGRLSIYDGVQDFYFELLEVINYYFTNKYENVKKVEDRLKKVNWYVKYTPKAGL